MKNAETHRHLCTHRKTGIWLSGHLMEKLQNPGNSVWLSYERWTGKWGYCIQLNKDTWFIVYSWVKGTGLDNLGGHSLDNGAGYKYLEGERRLSWTFSECTAKISIQSREVFTISLSLVQRALCHYSMGLKLGISTQLYQCQQHPFTQNFTLGSLHFLQ